MERIAIIDFFDDRESIAIRHTGTGPDEIYGEIQDTFEAEGFDTITLFTREEWAEAAAAGWTDADALPTLMQLA